MLQYPHDAPSEKQSNRRNFLIRKIAVEYHDFVFAESVQQTRRYLRPKRNDQRPLAFHRLDDCAVSNEQMNGRSPMP